MKNRTTDNGAPDDAEAEPPGDGPAQLGAVLGSTLDCVILMDRSGRIREFNPAAERTFGYTRDQVIGRELAETIIPQRLRERHRAGLRRYLADGRSTLIGQRIEMPALRADGSEFPVELTVSPATLDGEMFFTGHLRDISERQRAERQLHLRVAQQAAVAELGQQALASESLQALLDRAVRLVAEALDNALCHVLELRPDDERFLVHTAVGWPDDVVGRVTVGMEGQAGHTVRTGEPVIIEDLREEARFTRIPLLVEQGVVSGMSVVIPGPGDVPWGVLATHSTARQQFTPEDVHFLQSVANTLATAIERARWEQSLLTSEARARARGDELDAIMESVPAIVWIAHDSAATRITGSRASHEFLGIPEGHNQSQTAVAGEAPTHYQMYQHGAPLKADELPVQRAARGGTVDGCELEARFADGSRKYLFGHARPLHDDAGRPRGSVAAFVEITARKRAEQERERLHARLEADRLLMEQILRQMPVGVVVVEAPSGKRLFRNPQVEELTGLGEGGPDPVQRQDFQARSEGGQPYTPDEWPLIRAMRDGEIVAAEEMDFTHPDGDPRTISAGAAPVRDAQGETIAAVATFHDITERKRREQTAGFLTEASDILASSLDYERTLETVVDLAVPRLADWCVVDIQEPDSARIRRFAAHADPAKVELAQKLASGHVLESDAPRGVVRVMRTGQPEWASHISDEMLMEAARDDEHLRVLRELGLRSYICMPIERRGRVFGAITLIAAESGPRDIEADLRLAEELSYRVALALDNASLYQEARREVADRQRAEHDLRQLNEQLEQRVAERTGEIEQRAAQLRALTAELAQAEQRERRRLAQVLHDHLQQLLVAGKLEVGTALSAVESDPITRALGHVNELLDQAIQESRSLTVELSPPVLYDAGLAAGLEWLGRWMEEQHGLAVVLSASGALDPVDEDLRVLVFQAARELLFNVVKHAGTDRAEVTAGRDGEGRIEITVSDRGRGFDPAIAESASEQDQFGLFSIRERVARLGGDLSIHSEPGEGTRTVLTVPEGPAARAATETLDFAVDPLPGQASEPDAKGVTEEVASAGPRSSGVIPVVLADDHEVVREGLASALGDQPDVEVVGQASDGRAAVELVRSTRPAVVVLDVTMPGMNGIEAARAITTEFPEIRVIGLSMHDSAEMAAAMREAGAVEYVNKAAASGRLLAAIRGAQPVT